MNYLDLRAAKRGQQATLNEKNELLAAALCLVFLFSLGVLFVVV